MQKTEIPEDKNIKLISMHDEMSSSYLSYAMSVIVSRALPDIRDGLKPVHRRILYAMYKGGYDWSKQFRKSARIVGDVIGKYHPHGDQSVYDALVRMVQDFSMSLPLVDGQGNFGSIDGDPAAAMRYTETRLSKVSQYLIDDIEKNTISFKNNYDETEKEPTVLPAQFPNLLVNGAGGIAVGMATSIPPHNLGEIINGTLALIENKDINKIAFTGSTQVGKLIQKSLAGRDVGLTLELGGKAANIVYEDAAIDQAVEGVVNGIFFNQGHVCCAGSRLLLQESIHDEFVAKLEKRMQTLRVGNPLDKNTDIGAINSKEQLNKIEGLVNEGVSDGGKIFQTECELPGNGFWFKPTLFTDVQPSYSIASEEIFGPVLTTLTFRTPQEAVEIANNTEYGLSAGVWTEKGSKILWTADRLQAGVVWANTFNKFDPSSPFGGYKESGFGREGGRQGLLSYLKAES